MKIGVRKPSLKKMLSARTTGAAKRKLKKAFIPWYGKKGMGWRNPKKKIYNKIYNKTTVSATDFLKNKSTKKSTKKSTNIEYENFTFKDFMYLVFAPIILLYHIIEILWLIIVSIFVFFKIIIEEFFPK